MSRSRAISPSDLGSIAGRIVVRIKVFLRYAVSLGEIPADEDALEDDVGVEATLLGHPENLTIELLPLGEFSFDHGLASEKFFDCTMKVNGCMFQRPHALKRFSTIMSRNASQYFGSRAVA